jgi:hypothetical protein
MNAAADLFNYGLTPDHVQCACSHEKGWTTDVPPVCKNFEPDSVTGYCASCEHNRECHQ